MRKQDERKQQFKKGMDQEESRRRREATSVQIRKEKKEDSLQKRRAPSRDAGSSSGQASSSVGTLPDMTLKAKLENLPEDVALLQARAIRDNFGAQWGLAESGSVGGSSHPSGAPAGRSCAAVVGPGGFEFTRRTETGSEDRIANMEAFARAALQTLEDALRG